MDVVNFTIIVVMAVIGVGDDLAPAPSLNPAQTDPGERSHSWCHCSSVIVALR